jgi:hypothetical protein
MPNGSEMVASKSVLLSQQVHLSGFHEVLTTAALYFEPIEIDAAGSTKVVAW